MALPNYLPEVQDSRQVLGPGAGQIATFLINPGSADYVLGGYPITNIMCRLKTICCVWVSGQNQQAEGMVGLPDFELQQLQGTILAGASAAVGGAAGVPFGQTLGSPVSGYTQFNFRVYWSNSAVARLQELTTGYNLLGVGWLVTILGT